MTTSEQQAMWGSGAAYETYIGRWGRLVAREFLSWLAIPPDSRWLDVGCGTGAISQTVLEQTAPQSVTGVDSSEVYVSYARAQTPDPRAGFLVGDAQALPVDSAAYDAAISGLVINFVSNPGQMLNEMQRAVRPGGTVAVYLWDYADQFQLLRYFWSAASALDPTAQQVDETQRSQLCHPEPLRQLFQATSLGQIEVRPIVIPTTFRDFDDYWLPFLGGQGPASHYVTSLSEDGRNALRERLLSTLSFAADGSIPLIARAWAARGMKMA